MIRYLDDTEKNTTRELWEKVFPEDSKSFIDYYYSQKIEDNRILIKEDKGEILSMLQLNPYCMHVGIEKWKVDYIVGVATREDRRHQGHMRDILNYMLSDMYKEGAPFTFLMPADKDIYIPFDFTYIYDQPQWKIKENCGIRKEELENCGESDYVELSVFAEEWLEKRYNVFCERSLSYMKKNIDELKSEAGSYYLLYHDIELVGLQSVWGLERKEQRELLCSEEYIEKSGDDKPAIMARIVNLQEFIKAIHLKEDWIKKSETFKIRVRDVLIPENDGTWLWQLNKESSYIELLENEETADIPEYTVSELTSWLFGYRDDNESVHLKAEWCSAIETLDKVFIDEVV